MRTSASQLAMSGAGVGSANDRDDPVVGTPEQIREHARTIWSDDPDAQLASTQQLRKFLSIERNPPIQQVIDAGALPRLVWFLHRDDQPELQFEAAWALTNIASGSSDQCRAVVEAGSVAAFVRLASSPHEDVREQAVWALGNIAGDCVEFRDVVLASGALSALLSRLTDTNMLRRLRTAVWTLSNFCRGKPAPPLEAVSPALPWLARLLYTSDREVLLDTCWALSYISDGTNDCIQAVIETGVVRRLVELLGHHDPSVVTPALRVVGNITTGDDTQTQVALNIGALPALSKLFRHRKRGIKKEATWALSNITAGSRQQIQAVVDSGIIPRLMQLLEDPAFDVQKEAIWTISNAVSGGSHAHIAYLVHQGVLHRFCELLNIVADPRGLTLLLEGLENILKSGQAVSTQGGVSNPYAAMIEACGGVEKLEQLQQHQNEAVREPARRLLAEHFTPGSTASDRRNG